MSNVIYVADGYAPPELSPKDPSGVIAYTWDWSSWLDGETISTSVWTVPAGITKDDDQVDGTNQKATIVLSGGSKGERYLISNKITTPTRTTERSAYIRVVDR